VTSPLSLPASRSTWEVAIAALGLNLWVAFLLLPTLHLDPQYRGAGAWAVAILALGALAAGLTLRLRVLLVGLYPGALLLGPLVTPRLVGPGIYSRVTFVLMALSFAAYLLATLYLLGTIDAPPVPAEGRDLAPARLGERWRRRLRIHRWMAALALIFPAILLVAAFLHPDLQRDLQEYYPRRARAAQALVGVLAVALWGSIFYAYFLVPLRSHVRGDPLLRKELRRLRRGTAGRRPGTLFYIQVGAALALMLLLLLLQGG